MHVRHSLRILNYVFAALFIFAMGACGNLGGCGACGASQQLPGGALPASQTIEGGAQIRVTPQGFNKLTAILPGALNQGLANGFCVGDGDISLAGFPLASYCFQNQGQCSPGCKVSTTLNSANVSVTNQNQLNVRVSLDANVTIPIDTIITSTCTVSVSTSGGPIIADVNIALGINPADGELTVRVAGINNIDIGGIRFNSNGGAVCDVAAGAGNFITTIGNFIINLLGNLLTPIVDNLIQNLIPKPLGVAGMVDVGQLLEGVSPGTVASMEARIVPGGYVSMLNSGLSLGVITGLNADEDITTRTGLLASEPALCVPPILPPDFSVAPAALPRTTRNTFALAVAPGFDGSNEPAADLAMGVSETTLDLAGHHAVTSGMMCLGVGTNFIKQLNVGTVAALVPSMGELTSDSGNDPLLLVTRPTRALDFSIGENTATSPALTLHLSHLEVDFYPFAFERYTRAFTLDLSMNIGINLEFEQTANGAVIKPTLSGISAREVTIKALNTRFIRETPAELESQLPAVFDLVTPLLGDLPPINVPTFAGFSLDNLAIRKVVTGQDDFLALTAGLGVQQKPGQLLVRTDKASDGTARLVRVTTPDVAKVRAGIAHQAGGALPEVVFDVDRYDSLGRELEWTYNLDNGLFRDYRDAVGPFTIADRAFAFQGKYRVGLKSRVKGDYRTVSQVTYHDVIVDSVAPKLVSEGWTDDRDSVYELTIRDVVSGLDLQLALATPSADRPESPWTQGGFLQLSKTEMEPFVIDGELAVFAKDEAGNLARIVIKPFHGQPGEGGCQCNGGGPSPAGIALALAIAGYLWLPRRRRRARWFRKLTLASGVILLCGLPACDCDGAGKACELDQDCLDLPCPEGEIGFCIDGHCECADGIPLGNLGEYSDIAASPDGSLWVSAYHHRYGDLVVAQVPPQGGRIPNEAWQWVDGVPDGPVEVPQSPVRGGVRAKGPDVGMYTSIAVAPDGTVMVTYFDRDTGSLKFAALVGGVWQSHTIEAGTGALGETGALVGMYTSLSLRTDDGRPGVAYLAHVADTTTGQRAEVRFAAAQVAVPTSPADWMFWVVDSAPLPAEDPNSPDIYPLPEGLGLFVDLARAPNQAPVVAYYDRAGGQLKVSKFDLTTGQFGSPTVLDGGGNVDAGWSPSVAVDAQGVVHLAYVDSSNDDLVYTTDAMSAIREIVDDGRRIVGTTEDGLPKPENHFVGDDASLVLANAGMTPVIIYQDATTQELLMAIKTPTGWDRRSIAGATEPYPGGYGFFASDILVANEVVASNWVVDLPAYDNWVEVHRIQIAPQ